MTSNEKEIHSTFDNMIEIWFERWFDEYKKTQSVNCEDMKPVIRKAFITGWMKCEAFYS